MGKTNLGSVSDLLVVALNAVLAGCAFAAYKNWKKDKVVENVRELISDAYTIYHSSRQFYNTLYCYYTDSSDIQIDGKDVPPEEVRKTLTEQYEELKRAHNKLSKNIDILCYFYQKDESELFKIRTHSTFIKRKVSSDLSALPDYKNNVTSIFNEIKEKPKKVNFLDLIVEKKIFCIEDPNKSCENYSLIHFKSIFTDTTKSVFKL